MRTGPLATRPFTSASTRLPRSMSASAVLAAVALLSACVVAPPPPPRRVYVPPPPPVYAAPAPQAVVSVYVEPPMLQPEPILVGWAPPPMLVETVAPFPFPGAVWIGGYWVWEGNWVWAAGRWAPPPQPNYAWVHPYYENRDGAVVFITGHWSPPGVVFVPPMIGLHLTLATASIGIVAGPRPIGPPGVFVPAPPGSRLGIIVPAPIGTPPAVVTSAAPVVNVGMRIQNNTRITNVTNVTNVNNVNNVTIVAPASATANGRAFESSVPAQAHLAAALPSVVHANAPTPASTRPIPSFTNGRAPMALPPAQQVRTATEVGPPPARAAVAPSTVTPPAAPVANPSPPAATSVATPPRATDQRPVAPAPQTTPANRADRQAAHAQPHREKAHPAEKEHHEHDKPKDEGKERR